MSGHPMSGHTPSPAWDGMWVSGGRDFLRAPSSFLLGAVSPGEIVLPPETVLFDPAEGLLATGFEFGRCVAGVLALWRSCQPGFDGSSLAEDFFYSSKELMFHVFARFVPLDESVARLDSFSQSGNPVRVALRAGTLCGERAGDRYVHRDCEACSRVDASELLGGVREVPARDIFALCDKLFAPPPAGRFAFASLVAPHCSITAGSAAMMGAVLVSRHGDGLGWLERLPALAPLLRDRPPAALTVAELSFALAEAFARQFDLSDDDLFALARMVGSDASGWSGYPSEDDFIGRLVSSVAVFQAAMS